MSEDAEETVWVRPRGSSGGSGGPTLHTDPECQNIPAEPVERPRSVYPSDTEVCDFCSGNVDRSGWLKYDRDLHDTLLDADPEEIDRGELR